MAGGRQKGEGEWRVAGRLGSMGVEGMSWQVGRQACEHDSWCTAQKQALEEVINMSGIYSQSH